jgi:shikimate dehydrogenase
MTDRISGRTRTCAVIGNPVEHTMSPAMHNAAFREMGIDYVYLAFNVGPERLPAAIEGVRALGMPGINVTIPHKLNVIPLLDGLNPLAEKIGAVNTVVNENGLLTGFNTDASGFLRALVENDIEPEGKSVVVLGAGGAARAVSFALADCGAGPVILNRSSGMERARRLAATVSKTTGIKTGAMELNRENLEKVLEKADILVNTTSVGMSPDTENSPVPADLLKPDLIVYDIIYNPVKTRLLRDAEAAGAATISGIDMLVWQGAVAFELWTGKKPPVEIMKQEVMKHL